MELEHFGQLSAFELGKIRPFVPKQTLSLYTQLISFGVFLSVSCCIIFSSSNYFVFHPASLSHSYKFSRSQSFSEFCKHTWPFGWQELADTGKAMYGSVQQDTEIPPRESATYVGQKKKYLDELAIIDHALVLYQKRKTKNSLTNKQTHRQRIDWQADRQIDWKTDWPADWLTDWQTNTDWLTDWQTDKHWGTDWQRDRLTDWLTDRETNWLTDGLTDWLTDRLTDRQTDWLTDRLTD